jgi:hypothetical protein
MSFPSSSFTAGRNNRVSRSVIIEEAMYLRKNGTVESPAVYL